MERNNFIFRSLIKSHFASLLGIFVFVVIVSGIFCSLFTVLHSTSFYEKSMLEKGQFGDVSYWLTNFTSENEKNDLIKNISELESVNSVNAQNLVMANYEVHHTESDSEGCFIVDDGRYRKWRIDNGKLKVEDEDCHAELVSASASINDRLKIENGECLVPFSFSEIYEDAEIGEKIDVIVGRNGISKALTIAGFFEDPFMGSTMFGMKTILISQEDFEEIALMSKNAGIDALARSGILLHISVSTLRQGSGTAISTTTFSEKENFSQFLNENTNISKFTEDVHSTETMMNFMMLLSNSFAAMFGSFAIVLFFVTAFVLCHSIKSAIGDERKNFGIYKELGYTTKNLALNFSKIVMIPILCGGIFGFVLSPIFSKLILKMQISTTSLFVPVKIPFLVCSGFLILLFVLLLVFVFLSIRGIKNISPLSAIRELGIRNGGSSIHKNGLLFWIAFRQVVSKKRNYFAALIISILLVIFASFAGRINSWLGKNGEGLMDAFNPTNLHLGVQSFGEQTIEDFESIIKEYSQINEHYVLGMPTLRLNGKDYRANVTDSPEHFHIFEGRVCENENEIVITEFLLKDLDLKIGDVVKIGSRYVRGENFTIVGTYQCANDVGENFGMTQNGYFRIGRDNPSLWCHHYLLNDETKKKEIMKVLEEKFGSDVHVHENAWPGLYGILTAMKMLIFFMYGVSGLFILIAIILSGKKILNEEKTDLNNYRLLGFSYSSLRLSFSIRFLIVSVFGSGIALLLSELISDSLINILMRSAGIAGFSSHLGLQQMIFPPVIITFMFVIFAWVFGRKIRNWR